MDDCGTQVLVKAYGDLLELLVAVREVFTNKNGQLPCKPYSQVITTWRQLFPGQQKEMLTPSAHKSDRTGFRLFLKITWEPFEMKFKPIEARFMHHALVIVRTANVNIVKHTLQEYDVDRHFEIMLKGNFQSRNYSNEELKNIILWIEITSQLLIT